MNWFKQAKKSSAWLAGLKEGDEHAERKMILTQSKFSEIKAAQKDVDRTDAHGSIWAMPVPKVIQRFEDAHVGGIADLGNPDAKNMISSVPNYEQFKQRLANTIRSAFGNSFSVYRSMSQGEMDNWKNGEDMGALSVTFSKSVADGFTNLAAVKDKNRVVIQITITPDIVVMRGSENEQELVVDGNAISAGDIRVLDMIHA